MVDNHQTLCRRGIVQLFNHPHPPKQYQTVWTSKTPPRIYSQGELRRRLTRSTEDLANKFRLQYDDAVSNPKPDLPLLAEPVARITSRSSSKNRANSPHVPDDSTSAGMERSPSLHASVHRTLDQIILPKDYNPVAALNAVENMEVFLSKTFYKNSNEEHVAQPSVNRPIENECSNNQLIDIQAKNFKQMLNDHRQQDLRVIACIIVELFLANKLRPLAIGLTRSLDERIESCKNVLQADLHLLPKCVQYPVQLLFSFTGDESEVITGIGLPKPTANQLLQPFLSNFLFPFPYEYLNVYSLLKSLYQYESTDQLLDIYSYFECDGSNCKKFEALDKQRTVYQRKIAECKVMACAAQVERLLVPNGYELFKLIDLILPHIIQLLTTESTSILSAWFLFDSIAIALGPNKTKQYLLDPILKLYDAKNDDHGAFLNKSTDSTIKFNYGAAFKSRKTIKLYHHSFLLRLIVRFGLNCFLNNFVPPLIEAIGGYKEPVHHMFYHYHDNKSNSSNSKVTSSSAFRSFDGENVDLKPDSSKKLPESDEMFSFDNESDEIQKLAPNLNLTDSSDNDADTISQINQFNINCTDDLQLNHSNAMEVTEETTLSESGYQLSNTSGISFEEHHYGDDGNSSSDKSECKQKIDQSGNLTSPTIPIPSASKRNQLSTIDCEIGSKVSTEDADLLEASMASIKKEQSNSVMTSVPAMKSSNGSDQQTQYQISDMSAESLIWLSHRLGPVLTARHLTRNLLKMLTLCYVGQENILPDLTTDDNLKNLHDNLFNFTIANGRVCGDRIAVKVLECLTSITTIYGDHFILLQYLPHVTEMIALCKKRITPSLEGGIISSLQLLKYLVPCLSDTVIMDQLHVRS